MIRPSGVVTDATGLVPFGHLGWGFRTRAEFDDRAVEYLRDGLHQNQYVEVVGDWSVTDLAAHVLRYGDEARWALADGRLGVSPVSEYYVFAHGRLVDPIRSVAKRVSATQAALGRGFSGCRAVVDASTVARTPLQGDAFARFEHLIDQKMSTLPVSALCAYSLAHLGPGSVSELTCLHPWTSPGATQFRLFALGDGTDELALAGEIDMSCEGQFTSTLARVLSVQTATLIAIDCSELAFIDHHGLLALDHHAAAAGSKIVLQHAGGAVVRMVELLALRDVVVDGPDARSRAQR